ncbi:hypothetical protein B0J11DRAFT_594558 [Dendryphion nanum]|uniref:Uncharacterized protein n=1 Tax=Dendryphion nanum TaxID=256645 RepID=A0A9P9IBF1_9PLEO|nr:hypothetical protein B0J11DRAFT_594558 [Dendryphion nanum]
MEAVVASATQNAPTVEEGGAMEDVVNPSTIDAEATAAGKTVEMKGDASLHCTTVTRKYDNLPFQAQQQALKYNAAVYNEIAAMFPLLPIDQPFDMRGRDESSHEHVHPEMNRERPFQSIVHIQYANCNPVCIGHGVQGSQSVRVYLQMRSQYPCIMIRTSASFSKDVNLITVSVFGNNIPHRSDAEGNRLEDKLQLDIICGPKLEALVVSISDIAQDWKSWESKQNNSFALRFGLSSGKIQVAGATFECMAAIRKALNDGTFNHTNCEDSLLAVSTDGPVITVFFQQQHPLQMVAGYCHQISASTSHTPRKHNLSGKTLWVLTKNARIKGALSKVNACTINQSKEQEWPIVLWSFVTSIGSPCPVTNEHINLKFTSETATLRLGATRSGSIKSWI